MEHVAQDHEPESNRKFLWFMIAVVVALAYLVGN